MTARQVREFEIFAALLAEDRAAERIEAQRPRQDVESVLRARAEAHNARLAKQDKKAL